MTSADLQAHGFRPYRTLPQAFTHCLPCGQYQWFYWHQAPSNGALIAACGKCGTLSPGEALAASRCEEFRTVAKEPAA